MKYWLCNYPLKIFILLNHFWAHLNCFPSAQRGCLRGREWYSTKRVNLTNETLTESSMQMRFVSSFIVSNSKCCMAAPLIRAKASCWIHTLPSIPVASFLSKIHTLEELRSQCYSLSDAAQRNRALAENRVMLQPSHFWKPMWFPDVVLAISAHNLEILERVLAQNSTERAMKYCPAGTVQS